MDKRAYKCCNFSHVDLHQVLKNIFQDQQGTIKQFHQHEVLTLRLWFIIVSWWFPSFRDIGTQNDTYVSGTICPGLDPWFHLTELCLSTRIGAVVSAGKDFFSHS